MKNKLTEWFNKKVQKAQWIHVNKESRIKFKRIYVAISFAIFLLFILSVVFFYLYGLRFDSEKPNPYDSGDVKVFLALGIIIFVIATILAIMILGVYFPLLFKNSQELYSKTKEHKEQVSKYNDEDLTKFNENELKWLFKLKWITKLDFQQFLAKIKAQIKNKKQNKDNKK